MSFEPNKINFLNKDIGAINQNNQIDSDDLQQVEALLHKIKDALDNSDNIYPSLFASIASLNNQIIGNSSSNAIVNKLNNASGNIKMMMINIETILENIKSLSPYCNDNWSLKTVNPYATDNTLKPELATPTYFSSDSNKVSTTAGSTNTDIPDWPSTNWGMVSFLHKATELSTILSKEVQVYLDVIDSLKSAIQQWTDFLKQTQDFLTQLRQDDDQELPLPSGSEWDWLTNPDSINIFELAGYHVDSDGYPLKENPYYPQSGSQYIPMWTIQWETTDANGITTINSENMDDATIEKIKQSFEEAMHSPVTAISSGTDVTANDMDIIINQIESHIQDMQSTSNILMKEMEARPVGQYQSMTDAMKQFVSKATDTMLGTAARI